MGEDAGILDFTVSGRRGDQYKITAWRQGADLMMTCTCPAGVNRRVCHHRVALLDGVVDSLTSGNEADVDRLRELMRGTRIEPVLARFCHAEREFGPDSWAYDHAKDELGDLLALGYEVGGPPGRERVRTRRTEQLGSGFDAMGRPMGWAFDVPPAFRTVLDVQLTELVDRERTRKARASDPNAAAIRRMVWTRGVPPLLRFEAGHILYERGAPETSGGRDWLRGVRRVVQVREAVADAAGKPGWVSFEVWTVADNELGAGVIYRSTQAAFCDLLRTGVLPKE